MLLVASATTGLAAGAGWLTHNWTPLLVAGGALAGSLVCVMLAWLAEGRTTLSGVALLRAPLYVLWKLPIYLGIFKRSPLEWNRTRR